MAQAILLPRHIDDSRLKRVMGISGVRTALTYNVTAELKLL